MAVLERLVTADELLAMPTGDARVELVEGRIVTMPPAGFEHGCVGEVVARALSAYGVSTGAGRAPLAETGFVLRRDPDTVRAPDVAFVLKERIEALQDAKGFFEGAPDLAVEVVSPSDTPAEVESKVRDYLEAGATLVWVIYPQIHAARVWRADGTTCLVDASGELSGEHLLPGFTLPLAEVFA